MKKQTIENRWQILALAVFAICFISTAVFGQRRPAATQASTNLTTEVKKPAFDEALYKSVQWRSIGPFRGGRSAAVTGVPGKPKLFYMGATGGGVWRTQDGGQTWENISDGYFGGSIGAVAVSEWDNNVIYAGGGEVTVRGNVSYGYGMWKSEDAGKTWKNIGLNNSRHIPRIRIHPKNPDLVYAAVLGDLFKSSEERGIYRSKDGGKTWERVLFANADAGGCDLILDPNNPRIIYASTWRIRRTPYSLDSGGDGSELWKSTDSGDTWTKITGNKGMPKGPIGIIGVTVSPQNSERIWAIIEANDGGVYRSDNAGETWTRVNDDRALRQRAWYYTRIYADTQDPNAVYVLNVQYHRSTDGGRTFSRFNAPHGDHHDMWIAPEDNQRMVMADDGGAQVSYDAGENWTTYHNQPTAQYYRVTTDDHFPYRIYGAQQDNSTQRVLHRTDGAYITERDWEESAGGESAHLAIDPTDNDIVFGGSYGGYLTRLNHRTKQERSVNVYPDNPMGYGAEGMKYRFQWNFPIFFSPHDDKKLYALSNNVHISTNGGQSWQVMSADLTKNDAAKLGPSGGPITKDNTSVEYYCTLFAGCESPYEKDLVWVGSDDGLVHMSRDGGKNWENVTPKAMPEWMMINSIDADPFVKGGAYIAGTRYKLGDYTPYLYKTKDYGKTWTLITQGIDVQHFTRVLRADPKRQGLLYAGTETAMYISFNDGADWQSFQLNLPIVPITDLAIKNDNLIAATQGRSFWIIDDLTPLHQLSDAIAQKDYHLFKPLDTYKMDGFQGRPSKTEGQNHPNGVMTHFFIKNLTDSTKVKLAFLEQDGDLIKEFATTSKEQNSKLEVKKGANLFVWNTRYPDAVGFDGLVMWAASLTGPKAPPGTYKVRLTVGDQSQEQEFKILRDPRSESTEADLQEQFNYIKEVQDKLSEVHTTVNEIREIRKQLNAISSTFKDDPNMKDIVDKAKDIDKKMTAVEEELYQTKNRSSQDPLNYPIRLNNKLAHLAALASRGEYKPTDPAMEVQEVITEQINTELKKFDEVKKLDLPAFNQIVRQKGVDAIVLKSAAIKKP